MSDYPTIEVCGQEFPKRFKIGKDKESIFESEEKFKDTPGPIYQFGEKTRLPLHYFYETLKELKKSLQVLLSGLAQEEIDKKFGPPITE